MSVLAAALPVMGGGLGIYLSNTGPAVWGENRCGLAMGRRLGDAFSIGGSVQALLLRFPEAYPNAVAISGDIGLRAALTGALDIGLYVCNITFSGFTGREDLRLPVVLAWGLGYQVTESIRLQAELEKDDRMPLRVKAGTECSIAGRLALRAGVLSGPLELRFGAGLRYKHLCFDIAVKYHPVLGLSPQAGLTLTRP